MKQSEHSLPFLVEDFSPDVLALKDAVTAYQESPDPISAQKYGMQQKHLDLIFFGQSTLLLMESTLCFICELIFYDLKDTSLSSVEKRLGVSPVILVQPRVFRTPKY